jgi:hypothetical protein
MASVSSSMGTNNRQEAAVGPVKRAMASAPVEQHEPLASQKRFHLAEANAGGRVSHLLQ